MFYYNSKYTTTMQCVQRTSCGTGAKCAQWNITHKRARTFGCYTEEPELQAMLYVYWLTGWVTYVYTLKWQTDAYL